MRQRRAKMYRKLMSLYSLSFGFREPYQILVDSEMCRWAIAAKTGLEQQLSTVLHGTIKPMITQCCIQELYLLGRSQQATVDLAKSFERRKCNHREAIPGDECIASVVGKRSSSSFEAQSCNASAGDSNKHRYAVATQSQALRAKLRLIPAVPIVHVNRAVMILEPPSETTLKVKQQNEEQASQPTADELAAIRPDEPAGPPRRRKGPKGPNPLSMKKKTTPRPRQPAPSSSDNVESTTGQKRKGVDVGDETEAPTTRKRKRRRKHGSSSESIEPARTSHNA